MARNNPASKIFELILAGAGLARKSQHFPRQGGSCLAKMYKFITKMSQLLAMVRKKVKIFLAEVGLAIKNLDF